MWKIHDCVGKNDCWLKMIVSVKKLVSVRIIVSVKMVLSILFVSLQTFSLRKNVFIQVIGLNCQAALSDFFCTSSNVDLLTKKVILNLQQIFTVIVTSFRVGIMQLILSYFD